MIDLLTTQIITMLVYSSLMIFTLLLLWTSKAKSNGIFEFLLFIVMVFFQGVLHIYVDSMIEFWYILLLHILIFGSMLALLESFIKAVNRTINGQIYLYLLVIISSTAMFIFTIVVDVEIIRFIISTLTTIPVFAYMIIILYQEMKKETIQSPYIILITALIARALSILIRTVLSETLAFTRILEQSEATIQTLDNLINGFLYASIFFGYLLLLNHINLKKLEASFSERNTQLRQIKKMSELDSLTGIYNRQKIDGIVNEMINSYYKDEAPFAILFVDIDDFKYINDTIGHNGGDIVLKEVAAMLKQTLRASDIIGRWGGDEFIICLPNTLNMHTFAIKEKLKEAVKTIKVEGLQEVSLSIGIANFTDRINYIELFKIADESLYHDKLSKKKRY